MRKNYYFTFDQANGQATMLSATCGGVYYVKRHYIRNNWGAIINYWYSIHKRRPSAIKSK